MENDHSQVRRLADLSEHELMEELGRSLQTSGLGMVPDDENGEDTDESIGRRFFTRQLDNIRNIYCTDSIKRFAKDPQSQDITVFVSSLIDTFAAYFGVVTGTILLVQLHKMSIDIICKD